MLFILSVNCAQYLIPADSMFNHPTEMPTLFTDSVITNLTLIHRESYYQCTEEKYGIHSNYKSWWLFKGCGGLFELNECLTDQTKTLQMKVDLELTPEQMEIAQKSYQEFGKLVSKIKKNASAVSLKDSVRILKYLYFWV